VPYGIAGAYRIGNRLTIQIELPDRGELSQTGRSENLVDPNEWITAQGTPESIRIKIAVCRPFYPGRRRQQTP
jgi:hypothetical protein